MKRFLLLMLALGMLFVFAACDAVDPDASVNRTEKPTIKPGELTISTMPPQPSIQYEMIRVGGGFDNTGGIYTVIESYDDLERVFGDDVNEKTENDYSVDTFKDSFAVAVFVTVATGGYSFDLLNSDFDGSAINIMLTSTAPSPDAMVTQAFQTVAFIINFDKLYYSENLTYNITLNGQSVQFSEHIRLYGEYYAS